MKINEQQVTLVIMAMTNKIAQKGAMNKMVSMHKIEEGLEEIGCEIFVPISHIMSELIRQKRVRYFDIPDAQQVYGFTQMQIQAITQPAKQEFAVTRELPPIDISQYGEPINISDDDLPF